MDTPLGSFEERSDSVPVEEVLRRAEEIWERANAHLTLKEWREQRELSRMVADPQGKSTFTAFIDRLFRAEDPQSTADVLVNLLDVHGIPQFMNMWGRAGMEVFRRCSVLSPALALCLVQWLVRRKTKELILPGEEEELHRHLRRRTAEGVRMNVNIVGDDVLGDDAAARRLEMYKEALSDPLITYISVKFSTLHPHLSSLAHDHTVEQAVSKFCSLLEVAEEHPWQLSDGSWAAKFVNVDMEEYRDLPITVDAFKRTLEKFPRVSAGLVLQAYIPNSFPALVDLTEWAKERVKNGGAPMKVRIVKGANMEMEKIEASLRGWPQAPYLEKWETDSNYYRLLSYALWPENTEAVHVGIASHNIFTLSHASALATLRQVPRSCVTFEMLEGMANHLWRAVQELFGDVLLYAPVAKKEHVLSLLGYLTRRFDENTTKENFLSHSFDIEPGSPAWTHEAELYRRAVQGAVSGESRRHQNRLQEGVMRTCIQTPFLNEPDTDFTIGANRTWVQEVCRKWMEKNTNHACTVPLVVGGGEVGVPSQIRERFDPSRPGVVVARRVEANPDDIRRAVSYAEEDWEGWRGKSVEERGEVLLGVAQEIRCSRGDLIGAGVAEGGKTIAELDPEISEAVDFAEYYVRSVSTFAQIPTVQCKGRGVSVVLSPWNFPIAIPAGGMFAALASGNTVILKPASDTALCAWELTQCFYRGGVPRSALQFLPCGGEKALQLPCHPDVDTVILTGGTETALSILQEKPGLRLFAETGGKNVTIVTPMADREQAIRHVLHSAFSNSGQKCSATSLIILVGEVFDDSKFRKQLQDAVQSMPVGSGWELHTKMSPLIRPPSGALQWVVDHLEDGEEWLVKPEMVGGNPSLWCPGVKWGVRRMGFDHYHELFGPVIGVMRADSLDEAMSLAHETHYGLTAGLESLDEREQKEFIEHMWAGNLYINRPTTGAIVGRQPFGGMGKSAIGLGVKAGGPNYVLQFMDIEDSAVPVSGPLRAEGVAMELLEAVDVWEQELAQGKVLWHEAGDMPRCIAALKSYLWNVQEHFGKEHLLQEIRGEDNIFRYLPIGRVVVRVHPDDSFFDVLARVGAAVASGNHCTVSVPASLSGAIGRFLAERCAAFAQKFDVVRENDAELTKWMYYGCRIRYAHPRRVPDLVLSEAAKCGIVISRDPPLMEGRIELTRGYYEEQVISNRYHRYGNLLWRGVR